MRIIAFIPAVALLAGCSVVPPQAWRFDPTQQQAKVGLPPAEAAALTDQLAQLQVQRNQIRSQIASEPDIWKRQAHYARLHEVGVELSPLERRLAATQAR